MKKAVRKSDTQVKNEISANATKDTGKYAKSWATKKTGENSHSLEMTVHSKNRYQLAHLLEKGHAKYVANRGIPVLDIGVPVLSMHAPFEVIHKNDLYMAYRAFSLFNNAQ